MHKTSLTRALFVAGMLAAAGGMAQADAIFYPDGSHVELGVNGVENGTANAVLARSSSTAPDWQTLTAMGLGDQSAPMVALNDDSSFDSSPNTTVLGAGPAMTRTETIISSTPVYVFPNIRWEPSTVLTQPHPMMSQSRSLDMDRSAAATFNSPTQAGEASTMTSGAPNKLTTNESGTGIALSPPVVTTDTTVLGAGPSVLVPSTTLIVPDTSTLGAGPSTVINPNTGQQIHMTPHGDCGTTGSKCLYLPG